MSREQAFVDAVASLRFGAADLGASLAGLEGWLNSLERGLAGAALSSAGLRGLDPSALGPSVVDPDEPDPSALGPLVVDLDEPGPSAVDPSEVDSSEVDSSEVDSPTADPSETADALGAISSLLATQVDGVLAALRASQAAWHARRDALQPAQALAGRFDDQAMLLVFGKFNAGKSSLCNFLAERFAAHGHAVRGFRLDQGEVVDCGEPFREGATETTSRLQGVILAERLVLLDTPGLHSVTDENAELTRRFTDSADGLLWLTSSASPGQVQELDALARELQRDKPLLPVVTRSDTIEEDEVDGALQRVLRNKDPANRRLQEDDVGGRAAARLEQMGLDAGLLRAAVSISVRAARVQGSSAPALAEAGFERLYAALLDLVVPALAYKQRKPAAVLLHHLQEDVLGLLGARVLPRLDALDARLNAEQLRLAGQASAIAQAVWRSVVPTLPDLLDEAERRPDAWRGAALADLSCRLSQAIDDALAIATRRQLADYRLDAQPPTRIAWATHAFVEGPAGHEQRYLALEAAVELALRETARLVEPCVARVTGLQAEVAALRALVEDHRQSLGHCRDALWRGTVPMAAASGHTGSIGSIGSNGLIDSASPRGSIGPIANPCPEETPS